VSSLVDQAAAAFQDGQFDRALELYSQARTAMPGNAEIPYNMGVAAYRKGDFQQAAEHLQDAIGLTNDAELRQRGVYNLGNAAYAQSLQAMQGQADPSQAQQQLAEASKHVKEALQKFKQAMNADASDEDARINAELSHRLLKQLEQMQQQSPQDQKNKDQEQKDHEKQDQQQQDQEKQDQGKQGEKQQEGENGQDEPEPTPTDESQQKTERNKEQPQQPQKPEASESTESKPEKPPSPEDSKEQPAEAPSPEPQPSKDDQAMDAKPQDEATTQPQDPGEKPAATQPSKGRPMTREAAERMLQLVRDKERRRRELLKQREALKYAPAERDW